MSAARSPRKSGPSPAECAKAWASLVAEGWLRDVPGPMQNWLRAEANWLRIAPGQHFAREGDLVSGLFGIARGHFMLEASLRTGEMAWIDMNRAPFWLVSRSMIIGNRRLVTAVARTEIIACHVPQAQLLGYLNEHPQDRAQMMRVAVATFEMALAALADALIPDNQRRAIAVLLRIAGPAAAAETPVVVPVGQDELARLSNQSRQTVGDLLRALAADGVVTLGYRRITINGPARLQALLAGA
jgi:CRP-like cAMP-binding protein